MKTVIRLLTAVLVAALLAACGGQSGSAKPPAATGPAKSGLGGDMAKGKEVFTGTCASCHGVDARGMPGLGKNLVTSTWLASQNDQQMLDFLKRGRPASDPLNTTKVDMPPKGGNPALTEDDLKNVIAFLRSINKPPKS